MKGADRGGGEERGSKGGRGEKKEEGAMIEEGRRRNREKGGTVLGGRAVRDSTHCSHYASLGSQNLSQVNGELFVLVAQAVLPSRMGCGLVG